MVCEEVEREVFTATRRGTEGAQQEEEDKDEEEDRRIGEFDADVPEEEGHSGDDEEPEDEDGGVRLPCPVEDPTATITTATTTTNPMRVKMDGAAHIATPMERGMQKAKEREMVRRAARRGVAFGFEMEEGGRRSVEAVQGGRVVESSFAKGEWGVRWIKG